MTTRVTTKAVIFAQSFVVDAACGEQPPGIYIIETEERWIETVSSPAYRRISTLMHCPTIGGTRRVAIDPEVLNEALRRDVRPAIE